MATKPQHKMVINHLPTGMILQVMGLPFEVQRGDASQARTLDGQRTGKRRWKTNMLLRQILAMD